MIQSTKAHQTNKDTTSSVCFISMFSILRVNITKKQQIINTQKSKQIWSMEYTNIFRAYQPLIILNCDSQFQFRSAFCRDAWE